MVSKRSQSDHYFFAKKTDTWDFNGLLIYVDGILIISSSNKETIKVKEHLNSLFTVEDVVINKYFLGIEVCQNNEGTFLSQAKYISDLIEDAGTTGSNAETSPLDINSELIASGVLLIDPKPFRR